MIHDSRETPAKHFQMRLLNQTMPLISIIALQDLSISALG